jgi:hypothetical protein
VEAAEPASLEGRPSTSSRRPPATPSQGRARCSATPVVFVALAPSREDPDKPSTPAAR